MARIDLYSVRDWSNVTLNQRERNRIREGWLEQVKFYGPIKPWYFPVVDFTEAMEHLLADED